jgi:hypothetical protein
MLVYSLFPMTKYENQSGNSGVASFRIGPTSIAVAFRDGGTYLYTYTSAGRQNVEKMKILARAGQGLSTFISQQVKHRFARKLR